MPMQKKYVFLFLVVLCLGISACSKTPSAQSVVDQSIHYYGMDELEGKTINFDFREFHYRVELKGDDWFYERSFTDSTLRKVKDQLSAKGFVREIDGLVVPQNSKDSLKYAESVNSVVYFALLPLKLNDDAVEKKYLRSVMCNGRNYHQIEVTFKKEKGGTHYEDVYYFWFKEKDKSLDYFAYSSGGNRFRSVNGLVKAGDGFFFQNYINLENKGDQKTPLSDYHILFEQDKLTKLSEINLTNIKVE
jgi:hypothetical protein